MSVSRANPAVIGRLLTLLTALLTCTGALASRIKDFPQAVISSDEGLHGVRPSSVSDSSARAVDAAAVARWLVHATGTGALATTSVHLQGLPFASAISFSDGVPDKPSSGHLWFYMSAMDVSCDDILANATASLTLTEASIPERASWCQTPPMDEEDPNCVKLTITGNFQRVSSADTQTAEEALFARHPDMKLWPRGHKWLILELKPTSLFLLDAYGGAKHIPVEEFMRAEPAPAPKKLPPPPPATGKPPFFERARRARWLVHSSRWGTLGTTSVHLFGAPFGSAISFSDGADDEATGRIFMYLTKMDAAAQDIAASSSSVASFTLTEMPLGVCKRVCAEDPTCARITLTGHVRVVNGTDTQLARDALFSRHPAMARWPAEHHFEFYELHIETIFFLDMYGGAKPLELAEYWKAYGSAPTMS